MTFIYPSPEVSTKQLDDHLGKWYKEFETHLEALSKAKQQWYIEGLVHAFNAMNRYGYILGQITYVEREMFIGAAMEHLISYAGHNAMSISAIMNSLRVDNEPFQNSALGYAYQAQNYIYQIIGRECIYPHPDFTNQTINFEMAADSITASLVTREEKEEYVFGLFQAFYAIVHYARPEILTPLDRENFIGSAKSRAYSQAYWLKLDPETRMRPLIESDSKQLAFSLLVAELLHKIFSIPVSFKQSMNISQIMLLSGISVDHRLKELFESPLSKVEDSE